MLVSSDCLKFFVEESVKFIFVEESVKFMGVRIFSGMSSESRCVKLTPNYA